jgi:hypothetical protein
MCDGPIQFSGSTVHDLDPIPANVRSATSFSKVQMPYVTHLLMQELNMFLNMGMRILTTHDVTRLKGMDTVEQLTEASMENSAQPLPQRIYPELKVPEQNVGPSKTELGKTTERLLEEIAELGQFTAAPTGTAASEEPVMSSTQVPPTTVSEDIKPPVDIVDGVAPVITIDTTAQALARDGLTADTQSSQALPQPPAQVVPKRRFTARRTVAPAAPVNTFAPTYVAQETIVPVAPSMDQQPQQQQQQQQVVAYGTPAAVTMNETALVQEGGYPPSTHTPTPTGPLTVIKLE